MDELPFKTSGLFPERFMSPSLPKRYSCRFRKRTTVDRGDYKITRVYTFLSMAIRELS